MNFLQRKSLGGLLLAGVISLSAPLALAKDTTHSATQPAATASAQKDMQLLFVQAGRNAILKPIDIAKGKYQITLQQIDPYISYFTDAPHRKSGLMRLDKFYENWQNGSIFKTQFKPNVAMQSVDIQTKEHVNRVFEVSKPSYDATTHSVTYQAKLLGQQGLPKAEINLGYTVLFIDDFHWSGNPFEGHH